MLAAILATSPLKPEFWLEKAGASAAWVIAAIIFAESGLFFGFFLPGDSLLFMAGFLTSSGAAEFVAPGQPGEALAPVVNGMPPLLVILPLFFVAAVIGDQVGYWFGKGVGPALFTREDSRLFKQSHVTKAHDFLEKYGPKTIFLARFVPIVRTFAPIVAGVGEMKYRTFLKWNILGALVWAVGVTTLGHVAGNIEFVREHIDFAIIGIVALSLTPVAVEVIRDRRHKRAAVAVEGEPSESSEGGVVTDA